MDSNYLISELTEYAIRKELISEYDRTYSMNRIMHLCGLREVRAVEISEVRELHVILGELCDLAYENGKIDENTVTYRDLFDTALMGELMDKPGAVIKKFRELYEVSREAATDYFYGLAFNSNYIRGDRIKKDLKWTYDSEYGVIDITVNLAKPEKDPKAIAAAKAMEATSYPSCPLCHENEGFAGDLSHAARQTLRQIPLGLAGESWYLQYSPYVYYNEHCILLSGEHKPMKMCEETFIRLCDFIDAFPHYFMGSNSDLPITGGSILTHEHMQGGRYEFAMERAKVDTPVAFDGFSDVECGIIKWPTSSLRLSSENRSSLIALATKILNAWRGYTDESVDIFAYTDGEIHNTITPIARRRGGKYEIDIALRNNLTTPDRPLGLYHPHARHHNIKKENIGVIEVMGLAVLPSRLKAEVEEMKRAILGGIDFATVESIEKHKEWYLAFKDKYEFTEENIDGILRAEIGRTFVEVLKDTGVFKDSEEGRAAFHRFIASAGGKII